jgi:PLP dependent protein
MSRKLPIASIDATIGAPDGMLDPMELEVGRNLRSVRQAIAAAADGARRDPGTVRLVAVTKTFPAERVVAAYRVGARDIGENRIEEARDKISLVNEKTGAGDPVRWHLIGHLQRRKAREAVELFHLIQSVDSVKLAETLNRHGLALGKRVPILLQVNVAEDPHKFGFRAEPREVFFDLVSQIQELPSIRIEGLMTIGPPVKEAEQARMTFRSLRELRDELAARFSKSEWAELSMGMTDDFSVAISEGATIVRIGRAIFGERT